MLEGENIVSAARKAIIRHDFSTVLTVFPILRHLKQTKPEFDQVLQVCGLGGPKGLYFFPVLILGNYSNVSSLSSEVAPERLWTR